MLGYLVVLDHSAVVVAMKVAMAALALAAAMT